MRGADITQESLFTVAKLDDFVPASHPLRAIRKLAAEYAGRMRIYCGIEEDSLVPLTHRDEFDYVIGSVHRLPLGDSSFCVDDTPEELQRGLSERFHGDGFALAQAYYEAVIDNVLTVKPEILGHFDLLTKFNEGCRFFDENSPEYLAAALEAAQTCAETGVIFEINTGGMARGWRTAPYPARPILQYLKDARIPVLVSTDCHSAAKIDYGMEQARALLRDVGFTETVTLEDGEFKEQPL